MSSGFVSGGTNEKPTERDDDWLRAQQEIEANRRRKDEANWQEGGKTLYEVLQNNKAAKQEAFEEATKLKNQFRNLDEDEVEFLDSVLESTRKQEEDVKRETIEQLDLFRKQQEEADRALLEEGGDPSDLKAEGKAGSPDAGDTQWAVNARKRKRVKEKEGLKGIKLRKSSSAGDPSKALSEIRKETANPTQSVDGTKSQEISQAHENSVITTAPSASATTHNPKASSTNGLGLAGYSSDEED
ncbi:hypothetical protein ACLMJK_003921 [Lecanora helva]